MRKSMKGMTSLLVIFAAVVVIGMLFFTKQNVVSGFANMVATKAAMPKPMPKAPKPMPKPSMPSAPKTVAAAPLRR